MSQDSDEGWVNQNATLLRALFVATLFVTAAELSYGEDSSLNVEINAAPAVVKSGQEFLVNTRVKNFGGVEQKLKIWSCSYPEQWTADSPSVHVEGVNCKKNVLVDVRLRPGGAYEKQLSLRVWVAPKLSEESVTFRLGFASWVRGVKHADAATIWSNGITVKVKQ